MRDARCGMPRRLNRKKTTEGEGAGVKRCERAVQLYPIRIVHAAQGVDDLQSFDRTLVCPRDTSRT